MSDSGFRPVVARLEMRDGQRRGVEDLYRRDTSASTRAEDSIVELLVRLRGGWRLLVRNRPWTHRRSLIVRHRLLSRNQEQEDEVDERQRPECPAEDPGVDPGLRDKRQAPRLGVAGLGIGVEVRAGRFHETDPVGCVTSRQPH